MISKPFLKSERGTNQGMTSSSPSSPLLSSAGDTSFLKPGDVFTFHAAVSLIGPRCDQLNSLLCWGKGTGLETWICWWPRRNHFAISLTHFSPVVKGNGTTCFTRPLWRLLEMVCGDTPVPEQMSYMVWVSWRGPRVLLLEERASTICPLRAYKTRAVFILNYSQSCPPLSLNIYKFILFIFLKSP